MLFTAAEILGRFVRDGKLDPRCRIETIGTDDVAIVYLRVTRPHTGVGRAFLHALKTAGFRVHVRYPTADALPFWRRMRAEALLDDNPDLVRSWDQFLGALESQMKKPESVSEALLLSPPPDEIVPDHRQRA
ncbi:MAG TPA: hypothetical protein VGD81_03745 [Opitutaceae bacterium]